MKNGRRPFFNAADVEELPALMRFCCRSFVSDENLLPVLCFGRDLSNPVLQLPLTAGTLRPGDRLH